MYPAAETHPWNEDRVRHFRTLIRYLIYFAIITTALFVADIAHSQGRSDVSTTGTTPQRGMHP